MADIRFIYAPIGGGKTLFSVMEICRELDRTERFIVTNIPLCLANAPEGYMTLQEWCHKWITRPVDISARLAVLTKEQSLEHWRYLPAAGLTPEQIETHGLEIITNNTEQGISRVAKLPLRDDPVYGRLTDFGPRHRKTGCFNVGCHYFVDEVHGLYSSRNYQKISPDAENYQSQLRKLDDDQTLISQHPEKVDKNFRRNATEWMQVQNMARSVLFMGVTIGGNRFRYHYYNQASMPDKNDRATTSGWYSFDKKKAFHQLYYTMDGVGVSGGLVKESSRVRGRSPLIWVFFLVGIIVFAYAFPRIVQKTVQAAVSGTVGGFTTGVQKGLGVGDVQPATVAGVAAVPSPSPVPPSSAPLPVVEHRAEVVGTLYCKGWVKVGDNMRFYLSDGRVAYSERGEVQGYGARFVRVFGLPPVPVKI